MPETHRDTILAFDFGIRRIGVAVGEPETGTAHPLPGIALAGDARFAAIGGLVAVCDRRYRTQRVTEQATAAQAMAREST